MEHKSNNLYAITVTNYDYNDEWSFPTEGGQVIGFVHSLQEAKKLVNDANWYLCTSNDWRTTFDAAWDASYKNRLSWYVNTYHPESVNVVIEPYSIYNLIDDVSQPFPYQELRDFCVINNLELSHYIPPVYYYTKINKIDQIFPS